MGTLEVPGDRDYFKFTVTQQNSYAVFTRGTTDTVGELYDSNLSQLAVDPTSGESPNFRIEKILLPGTYYVLVRAPDFSTVTGSYQLHIEGPDAPTVSDDHGFSFWSATAVNVGSITLGNLNLVRDRDYFRFTVTQQNSYTVFTRGTTDTVGELYDSNLSQLAVDPTSGESPNFRIEKILLPG
ncbi:MAG: hypothetical protein AB1898_18810, partial [Acidobacteriota bacterium]